MSVRIVNVVWRIWVNEWGWYWIVVGGVKGVGIWGGEVGSGVGRCGKVFWYCGRKFWEGFFWGWEIGFGGSLVLEGI